VSTTAKTRLEKAAADNGFDLGSSQQGDWLHFRSSHSPLRVWLKAQAGGVLIVALSRSNVLVALEGFGSPISDALPDGACGAQTGTLPRSTEVERSIIQRVGQDIFRRGLLEYWDSRCAISGLAVPELLRASHIKPWAVCENDAERLDVFKWLLAGAKSRCGMDRPDYVLQNRRYTER
jgi:putative restriction endonuclease